MSCFRNLNKVVSSQLFTQPNQFLLTSCFRPVYLETSSEATIEYLHSSKALVATVQQLQGLAFGSHAKLVNDELQFLDDQTAKYSLKIREFIHKRGLLTA